jgi:hypothetical protein
MRSERRDRVNRRWPLPRVLWTKLGLRRAGAASDAEQLGLASRTVTNIATRNLQLFRDISGAVARCILPSAPRADADRLMARPACRPACGAANVSVLRCGGETAR